MKFEIDNVELDFDGEPLLRGIYLKAETGKITGILGSNGTGKSSLLSIIFGNLNPLHKLVRIDNKAYLKPLFTTGHVKYLPQHSIVPSYLSVQNAFSLYNVDWKIFLEDFPEFRKFRNFKPLHLSSGQQRLIEIYLNIKTPAKLLLLDEPFTHLGPLYIEKFKFLLLQEKKEKAIVITDHMYDHLIDASDELYLLKNGCSKYINNLFELEDYQYLRPGTL